NEMVHASGFPDLPTLTEFLASDDKVCGDLRGQAAKAFDLKQFESATNIVERLLSTVSCNPNDKDRAFAALLHAKAAGLDGGAYARAVEETAINGGDLISVYQAETTSSLPWNEAAARHLKRGIDLQYNLKWPGYDLQ